MRSSCDILFCSSQSSNHKLVPASPGRPQVVPDCRERRGRGSRDESLCLSRAFRPTRVRSRNSDSAEDDACALRIVRAAPSFVPRATQGDHYSGATKGPGQSAPLDGQYSESLRRQGSALPCCAESANLNNQHSSTSKYSTDRTHLTQSLGAAQSGGGAGTGRKARQSRHNIPIVTFCRSGGPTIGPKV